MLYNSPLEQFEILLIYPISLFGLFDISITNSVLYSFIIINILLITHFSTLIKINFIKKSYFMPIFEFFYNFILNMIKQQSGNYGQVYFVSFFFTFWIILLANFLGLFPYSFTITGHIVITFFLALSYNLSFLFFGIYKHGLSFFYLFVPKGSPSFLLPLLVIIELLSYLLRTLSLSIRLFANMMAGHTLMFILSSFIISFISLGYLGVFSGFLVYCLLFSIFLLELGIAFLQAYVFIILLTIYLRDGIEPSH